MLRLPRAITRQRRDSIEIRAKGEGLCSRHDVILYRRGDAYVLHRVVKVRPDGYVAAGDNNAFLDPFVSEEQVLGVMKRIIRDGRDATRGGKKVPGNVCR